MSTQWHHLKKFGSIRVPDAAYQLSRSPAFGFRENHIEQYTGALGLTAGLFFLECQVYFFTLTCI